MATDDGIQSSMSIETDGVPAAESPTAENETETTAAPVDAEASTAAESSNADEEGAQPKDLLSVVQDAVKKDEGEAESPTVEGKEKDEAGEVEDKPEGKSEADQAEADAKLPFNKHPRWKEVLAERDSFRDDAGRFRQIEGFMQTHGLSPAEVGEGFDIMSKLKSGTPTGLAEAREYFASRLVFLDQALGNVLPEDLQKRVDEGLTDVETAKELAKTRAAEKLTTEQLERRNTTDTETREREARVATANAMATAVDGYEQTLKTSDPDYAHKAELVETTCRAIVQRTGKPPSTPEAAVQLVKDAYAEVNKQFKKLQPPPKPVRPTPQGSSAQIATAPKTLREAISAAL